MCAEGQLGRSQIALLDKAFGAGINGQFVNRGKTTVESQQVEDQQQAKYGQGAG